MSDALNSLFGARGASGSQALLFDARLASAERPMTQESRDRLWSTLVDVLMHRPDPSLEGRSVGLLLGRIQSGKTTAMTGLAALGHDLGYRLVVAVLGSTNLLLQQNTRRLLDGLGVGTGIRSDYTWAHIDPASVGRRLSHEVAVALESERSVLITVLKNSRRLSHLAQQLDRLDLAGVPCLVLDDEADQASLNTLVAAGSQSPTYAALTQLMSAMPSALYLQVTATPFAPLLLEPSDQLSPSFLEVLEPGPGYTGSREFFVDNANTVVRLVSSTEALTRSPQTLPLGLRQAFANYLMGAATLLAAESEAAPVSMLVHPTQLVHVHARVALLLHRELAKLRDEAQAARSLMDLPKDLIEQHEDLLSGGAPALPDEVLLSSLRSVLRLCRISVVNSSAEQNSIDWSSSPAHVLVGGNKLDRGFTVEGLTVSYLSRAASPQADTLAQRARAFGYRRRYLPYCRFFASSTTVEAFRASVLTEEAMRSELLAWVGAGKPLADWAEHVGFVLGDGLTPTRNPVAPWLTRTPTKGWHVVANPDFDPSSDVANRALLDGLELFSASRVDYGRLGFRTLERTPVTTVAEVLSEWRMSERAGWSRSNVTGFMQRVAQLQPELEMSVVLMDAADGAPRTRAYISGVGFSNLMQGRDNGYDGRSDQYAGDRTLFGKRSGLQVHYVTARDRPDLPPVLTLALHIGDDISAATEVRRA